MQCQVLLYFVVFLHLFSRKPLNHLKGQMFQEALDGQHSTAGHYFLSSYEKMYKISNSKRKNKVENKLHMNDSPLECFLYVPLQI